MSTLLGVLYSQHLPISKQQWVVISPEMACLLVHLCLAPLFAWELSAFRQSCLLSAMSSLLGSLIPLLPYV